MPRVFFGQRSHPDWPIRRQKLIELLTKHDCARRQFRIRVFDQELDEFLVQVILSWRVRFRCSHCRAVFTEYPLFALPHKRFVKQDLLAEPQNYLAQQQSGSGRRARQRLRCCDYRRSQPNGTGRTAATISGMWLFHSVSANELHPDCMRRRLLEYCYHPPGQVLPQDLSLCESEFEREVATELVNAGYRVIPQYPAAGKRIDLVVEGTKARLAIECDGDRWHGADRYEADMARQRMLERCGWKFVRVRGSSFYANRQREIGRIVDKAIQTVAAENVPPDAASTIDEAVRKDIAVGEDDRIIRDVIGFGYVMWMRLSRWGKEHDTLNRRERKFVYDVGRHIRQQWPLTIRQARWAAAILEEATQNGFDVNDRG